MLEGNSPELSENVRKQIAQWEEQPHVKAGYLTIWEASCLLAYDHGASDLLCQKPYEKRLIEDFCALVIGDLSEDDRLEGYSGRTFPDLRAEAYPVIAFRTWFRKRRAVNDHYVGWNEGHGRYFEQNARALEVCQLADPNNASDEIEQAEEKKAETVPNQHDKAVESCLALSISEIPNECRDVEPPEKEGDIVVPDDMEIVPGVTVGNIRALFDRNGKRYSSELAAAVWAWVSFEHDPAIAVDSTVKGEIQNGRLPDWDEPLKTEARKRIAIVVNWEKTPARH